MGITLGLKASIGVLVSGVPLISMVFIAANSEIGTAETRVIIGEGSGSIECIGGKSFIMKLKLNMIENSNKIVGGTIMVIDERRAMTIGGISEGLLAGKNFLLVSIDPKSLNHVPICHAGEDPNQIQVKGTIGNNTEIEFTATCNNVVDEGAECGSASGRFNANVKVTSGEP